MSAAVAVAVTEAGAVLIRRLTAERDELAERVRQLEAVLHDGDWVPSAWGLSPKLIVMLNVLMHRRIASREALFHAIYSDLTDPPGDKIIDVHMCRLRAQLRAHGVAVDIETRWGLGWELTEASLVMLRNARAERLSQTGEVAHG